MFFIVGLTAVGKSELAADVARTVDAEIVSADAFQIYRGFDLLSAKPEAATLAKAPHHLLGTRSILEEMNAAKFRQLALRAIGEIQSRGRLAIVVGGSGLYIKTLTHGLSAVPSSDPKLRLKLSELSLDDLRQRLVELDPEVARKIDMKNRRRVSRALEICLLSGKPVSTQRQAVEAAVPSGRTNQAAETAATPGIFVFRERADLHQRINQRVAWMFEKGVVEEVRLTDEIGTTAAKMIGFREIREHLEAKTSISSCLEKIQLATRQYAKRQLTWFRHQTNFEPLNLSLLSYKEAVERISQRASLVRVQG